MKRGLLSLITVLLLVGAANAQITSVGLIGTATPNGWDADTNMVQDPDSAHLWTLTVMLSEGLCKFRADDDWAVNWGQEAYPADTAVQDGPNIPIPFYGEYYITFNSNTGVYRFNPTSGIGILGSAVLFGWDSDVDMTPDTANPNMFWTELELVAGAAKFRANDSWDVNWGGDDFPSGTATPGGNDIPVPKPGNYTISFDTSTLEYNFKENVDFLKIGMFGDATPGGWDMETAMAQTNPDDAKEWTASVRLTDGGLQFSGDTMTTIWGGTDFPTGTATVGGDTIPATAGLYKVTFNTKTLEYNFEEVTIYESMGIIGDATPGGWGADTNMVRSEDDSSQWSLRVELLDGFAKFRANDSWDNNWGSGDFPSGTATPGGADIPVTAGLYNVTFNSFTLEYNFFELKVYDTIGIIGTGSPFGDWDNDTYMTKDPADENHWTMDEITLVDGEIKFRANSNWDVNWGDPAWPSGVGTQNGPNILCVAGTYQVSLNSISGEYAFSEPSATEEILRPTAIKAFPNPTSGTLNIDLGEVDIQGEVVLNIYDMNGQLVQSQQRLAEQLMQIDVANLPTGHYLLQLRNDKYIIGKRIAVVNN